MSELDVCVHIHVTPLFEILTSGQEKILRSKKKDMSKWFSQVEVGLDEVCVV